MTNINVLPGDERLLYSGRNMFYPDRVRLLNSCASVEFDVTGGSAYACFDSAVLDKNDPGLSKLKVYVDGVATVLELARGEVKEYALFAGLPETKHNVRLVKVNSAHKTELVFYGLRTSGALSRPAEKSLKLEVYGDSLTCGYGVLDGGERDTVRNEDGTRAMPYIVAERLGAQIYEQCYSGISVRLAVTSWGVPEDRYMLRCYDEYAPDIEKTKWDLSSYRADVILMNLGTNDYCAVRNGLHSAAEYSPAVEEFLRKIRAYNSTAHIVAVCSSGKMKSETFSAIKRIGDDKIYLADIPIGSEGYNGHPCARENERSATAMIGFLRENKII